MAAASNHNLPTSSPQAQAPIEQQAISQQLAQLIQQKIKITGGCISFAEFMQMALYTPGLGYYAGGAQKFGMAGDFVTAPEISPLFAQTLALQVAQILACSDANILELGAGTGKLAADLLLELQVLNSLPEQYFILEVSAHLRQVQLETCQSKLPKHLYEKLVWLNELPKTFNGLVFGNEVLDAIPVHILHKTLVEKNKAGWVERGVGFDGENNEFVWKDAELSAPYLTENLAADLPVGYVTEVNPAACALVRSLADMLEKGAILLIDYGFGAAEYYHPQRNQGTFMCHYQQLAHDNPLINIGLQDITAHVDFTSIAMLCEPTSMRLAGYVNQAQFLINCGILTILQRHSVDDLKYMQLAAAAQKLLSPAEMGELFKVICLTKSIDESLIGFAQGDKAHTL
jgi:SAM-dependent MidA family methyltransferase